MNKILKQLIRYIGWLLRYLGFRFWRWLLLSLCLYGMWKGIDGLSINLMSREVRDFTIEEVEKNGLSGSRYVRISGAFRGASYVYVNRLNTVESILYPITSYEKYIGIFQEISKQVTESDTTWVDQYLWSRGLHSLNPIDSSLSIRVVIKMNVSMPIDSLDAWANEYLLQEEDVEGIALEGWDAFNADDTELLHSMGLTFHDNLIIIEKGARPESPLLNFLYLFAGLVGFYVLYFRPYLQMRSDENIENVEGSHTE